MKITMRYFGPAREALGIQGEEIELSDSATVGDLKSFLRAEKRGLATLLPSVRIAVGNAYVRDDHELVEGDEAAVIPPVAGG